MKPRAVICDVYKTLLHVGPPPANPDARWRELGFRFFQKAPDIGLKEFESASLREIEHLHTESKRRGIAFPEIQWPRVLGKIIPEFETLRHGDKQDFALAQQSLHRHIALAPGAIACCRDLIQAGVPIGIASNAQAYTWHELENAIGEEGMGMDIFDQDLSLWSYQLGFSKPDPYFFQTLSARLLAMGLEPPECLMVGDRLDNDILPARAIGMKTWHLHPEGNGDWFALRAALREPS